MKFNTIIGNPPYQKKAIQGSKAFATAIYHHFISNAIALNPRYLSMIVPSRWMTKTASGIPDKWVDDLLKSNKFSVIHDFLDAKECFANVGIAGGVNYFLWDSQHQGDCEYYLHDEGSVNSIKSPLDELDLGFVLRDVKAKNIIKKIDLINGSFSLLVSPSHFFDKSGILATNWTGFSNEKTDHDNIKCYVNKRLKSDGIGWISGDVVPKNHASISLNKVIIPAAGGDTRVLGMPIYAGPNSVCSQTYLAIGYDPSNPLTEVECLNIITYIKTRFFRYLVSIKKKTQQAARGVYQLVPLQDFSKPLTDKDLYEKYNLSQDEIDYIESKIRIME